MFAPTQRNNSDFTKMKCRCGLDAALKVSTIGRKYLGCPRSAASGQCEFTRMLSDNVQGPSPMHSPNMNHMEEPTNTGSRNEIIDPNFTAAGLMNPMKRTPPAMENEGDPQLLPSQKRAKIIEAVLKGSTQDIPQKPITSIQDALARSISRPHGNGAPTEFFDSIPALENDFSRADTPDTTDIKYQEVRAETTVSSLHVNGSSQSVGSSSGRMDAPSLDGVPSSRVVNTDKSWLLHTPKRTEFERSASTTSVLSSWYKEKAPVVSSGESPSKKRYSAASVTNILEGLSGLPIYLRTLERDLEIKDMKIKHLENEVQRLNSKQGELEKLLQMYEQHSSLIDQDA